jgi:hypothetical protein
LPVLAALAGCGGGGDQTVVVYGRLVDALTGAAPMVGAEPGRVSIGGRAVETNESGFFIFELPAGGQVLLEARVPGYAETVRPVDLPAEGSLFVRLSLLRFGGSVTFDAAAGGQVSAGGASVTFGPGALDASGSVSASLAYLDASDPTQLAAFPGGFRTVDGELLESFGAIAVEVRNADGRLVGLRSGQSAGAVIPVTGSAEDTIPLWSFDEGRGRWVREGSLTACAGGACQADLPHLSWWNADKVLETTCLVACCQDGAGRPQAGVSLEATGIDYSGQSHATTGADGCACLDVRLGSQVQIAGVTSAGVVLSAILSTSPTQASCGGDGCTRLEEALVVERPQFQAVLTWGESPSDLDSHFTGPCASGDAGCVDGRFHVYYSSRGSLTEAPWAFLDTDDTTSFGPEITSLARCREGVYRYSVFNFSGTPGMEASAARVLILLPSGETAELAIPTGNPEAAKIWVVGDLRCDAACNCSWSRVNAYRGSDSAAFHP